MQVLMGISFIRKGYFISINNVSPVNDSGLMDLKYFKIIFVSSAGKAMCLF